VKKLDRAERFQALSTFIRDTFGVSSDMIPLHEPRFFGNEKKYMADVIDSSFVSSFGEYIDRFESMMCSITGSKYAVATVNGTAAMHTSLLLSGVQQGEEVITQALSFVATANSIKYCGADPVFLDVDKTNLGLSPQSLQDFLSKHTKIENGKCINKLSEKRIAAVVPMHTFGHPAALDELVKICDNNNIPLVEDAAESIGSYYGDVHTGTFGLLGAFSFNGNKTVTSGGGGAIVTNDEQLAVKAKHLTTTAKASHPWEYYHDMLGYNYRMPNLNAALACAQLEQLDIYLPNKKDLAKKYSEFCTANGFEFVKEPANCQSNHWLNAVIAHDKDERDHLLEFMNDGGIACRPIWTLLFRLPMYAHCYRDEQVNASWLEDRVINLPSSVRI